VPIVRETGGLADTVKAFNPKTKIGNGFVFKKYNSKEMMTEIKNALKIFNTDQDLWQTIMRNGMKENFSWMNSSKRYVDLYKKLTD
jgi:starch synthase